MTKVRAPVGRCGVYTSLDDVPTTDRLHTYAEQYADRDPWTTFLEDYLLVQHDSERFAENARRAGRYWKSHMADRGRHRALATPAAVEAWCADLLADRTVNTVYNQYWVRIERFYTWLQRRRDHPHLYHPPRMAAVEGEATGRVWAEKIGRGRDREADDA